MYEPLFFLTRVSRHLQNKGVHADDALSPDFFLSLLLLHLLQLPTIWSVSETVWLSFQFWAEAFGTPVAGIGGWPRFLFLFMRLFFLATLRIFCVEVIYKEVQKLRGPSQTCFHCLNGNFYKFGWFLEATRGKRHIQDHIRKFGSLRRYLGTKTNFNLVR